jgi:uncharacterized membrane protein (DUF2068 family)
MNVNRLALLGIIGVTLLVICGWHYTVTVAGVPVVTFTALRLLLGFGIWRALEWAR